jgi:hypothetical protein
MRRSTIAIALFVAALVLSNVKPGFACQGDKVLLAEDFSTADASWGGVTVTALDIGKPEASAGGLVFWAQDYRNAYFLLLATNGCYKIGRLMDGAWVNAPLDWTQTDAIVQGVNKPNMLRLTIKGQSLAVEINGKPGATLRAQSPGASSLICLYA